MLQVVALLALGGVLVGGGAIYTICRMCECCMRPRRKPLGSPPGPAAANGRQPQFMTAAPTYPATNGAYGASSGARGLSNGVYGGTSGRPTGAPAQGVTFDSRTGMFMLNGQPYGRMQGH